MYNDRWEIKFDSIKLPNLPINIYGDVSTDTIVDIILAEGKYNFQELWQMWVDKSENAALKKYFNV
jgi:hypothetical protein